MCPESNTQHDNRIEHEPILKSEIPGFAPKPCAVCGETFQPKSRVNKYCSNACRSVSSKRKGDRRNTRLGIATGSVGAIAELQVCADLLSRGYAVFRAVSPASPCDVVALKDEEMLRVEVRTGYFDFGGRVLAPLMPRDYGRFDVFAIVLRDEAVIYLPPLDGENIEDCPYAVSDTTLRKLEEYGLLE